MRNLRGAVLVLVAACSSSVPDPATFNDDDASAEASADVGELESGDATRDTAPDDVAPTRDAEVETAPTDGGDAGSDTHADAACVTRCIADAGVPLGYFCSVGKDCCSGNCGGPDKKCLPPVSACAGCWMECP